MSNDVSSYEGWTIARKQLQAMAESLGLETVGWVAVPANPPKIQIDKDGTWTCPHCKAKEDELEFIEAGDYGTRAWWNEDHWSVSADSCDTDTIAWCCPNCSGWVEPDNEVVWS